MCNSLLMAEHNSVILDIIHDDSSSNTRGGKLTGDLVSLDHTPTLYYWLNPVMGMLTYMYMVC